MEIFNVKNSAKDFLNYFSTGILIVMVMSQSYKLCGFQTLAIFIGSKLIECTLNVICERKFSVERVCILHMESKSSCLIWNCLKSISKYLNVRKCVIFAKNRFWYSKAMKFFKLITDKLIKSSEVHKLPNAFWNLAKPPRFTYIWIDFNSIEFHVFIFKSR